MKPEAALFLAKALDGLRQADVMITVDLAEAAGRTAYLAGFHDAQTFLFEETGKVFRSHKGVHAAFGRLTRNDPRFDLTMRAFLGRTYDLKAIADYETGPGSRVTREQAYGAIRDGHTFVNALAKLLGETTAT